MKMVKSLLLGSAAGVVAVAGAQAADLPVKAKPVEYVKICSLYGDGFFYVPGTETCVRIGASAQADMFYNQRANGHPHYDAADGAQDRTVSPFAMRGRIDIGLDSRTQTAYGTLRSVIVMRMDNGDQGTVTPQNTRGYIQWAGFTFGHLKSYSDPVASWGGGSDYKLLHQGQIHSDSGANGTNQIAYTWELGNGMVLIMGADERRVSSLVNLSVNATNQLAAQAPPAAFSGVFTPQVLVGAAPVSSRAGMTNPNPYLAIRGSQAWGSFSGAILLNDNRALYYSNPTFAPGATTGAPCTAAVPAIANPGVIVAANNVSGSSLCGNPSNKIGWAWLSGIEFKLPMIAQGDRIGFFFNYGVGAVQYTGGTNVGSPGLFGSGNKVALGVKSDGVYVNGSGLELTTAWTIAGAYEHYWMPNFSSTVFAGRTSIEYNATVVNSRWFCGGGGGTVQQINFVGLGAGPASCNPGFKLWEMGLHTDWYPVPGFRLGAEVAYILTETAFKDQLVNLTPTGGNGGTAPVLVGKRPAGVYLARDQGIATVSLRAQRGFGGVGE